MQFPQAGAPVTVPLVPTTRGLMHPSLVEMRRTVTQDNDDVRVVRTDKFIDGEWVGNDLHIEAKRWPSDMQMLTGVIGG